MTGDESVRLSLPELAALPLADRVEACRSFVERTSALIESARHATASATDPRGLVTAVVSDHGMVDEVRLELAAARCGASELEAAVLAAVSAAQAQHSAQTVAVLSRIQVDRGGFTPDQRAAGR